MLARFLGYAVRGQVFVRTNDLLLGVDGPVISAGLVVRALHVRQDVIEIHGDDLDDVGACVERVCPICGRIETDILNLNQADGRPVIFDMPLLPLKHVAKVVRLFVLLYLVPIFPRLSADADSIHLRFLERANGQQIPRDMVFQPVVQHALPHLAQRVGVLVVLVDRFDLQNIGRRKHRRRKRGLGLALCGPQFRPEDT